jgi:hypothetical protein
MSATLEQPDDCGCCAGRTASTDVAIVNRPGLSAVAYRVGDQAQFKETMLAALSAAQHPALAGLRTRADTDFSIDLLDAFATLADVLTFYQERIANESYLRTASERFSLLHLARLIGYELRPGVAAGTLLAFTLDDSPGAPPKTTIDIGVKVQSVPGPDEKAQTFETVEKIEARVDYNALKARSHEPQPIVRGLQSLYLDGVNTQLQPGDGILIIGSERKSQIKSEQWDFRILQTVTANPDKKYTLVTWAKKLGKYPFTLPSASEIKVYALRQRAALFGHNAVDPHVLRLPHNQVANLLDSNGNWKYYTLPTGIISLDAAYPKIVANSWVVLVKAPPQALTEVYFANRVSYPSRSAFALSGKTTQIEPDRTDNLSSFGLKETIVFAQTEELTPIDKPIDADVAGSNLTLDVAIDGLVKGQMLMASGKVTTTKELAREVVELADIQPDGDLTQLFFKSSLQHSYLRDDFALNANVARATHGATIDRPPEILGSGDAGQPYLKLPLRQSPLTYVSAANASGAESTLKLRINDLLWKEVPTLYGRGPRERVYITRTDDNSRTTVQFGDGVNGARPPSGQDNIKATYRVGIGKGGLVKLGQISLLLARPLGVREVINPVDATGAEDRQDLEDARRTSPLTVLTLDRTVSLQDYEDFARAFPGIAKALATWTWNAGERRVFLTVSGADGADVPATSQLYQNLLAALQNAGDPFVPVQVASYRKAFFRLAGRVKIDEETYLPDKVLAAVTKALRDQFSFAARDFGQPVYLSEVITVIQAVEGVVAVDMDSLYRSDQPIALNDRLLADQPAAGSDGTVAAAELLTLDPAPLDQLVRMK